MPKIRVQIVDDSVVMRTALSGIISAEADMEVAGVAANGRIALSRLANDRPDVVALDVEMPEMDGLATLSEIRKIQPTLPVIMFSALTARGTSATVEALIRGANDYVTKPEASDSPAVAKAKIRDVLLAKIRALAAGGGRHSAFPKPCAAPVATRRDGALQVVGIGVSTGGPEALAKLLSELPSDLPVPLVIVQHMAASFTQALADRLAERTKLNVQHGRAGAKIVPGEVWIAPGDYHMIVESSPTGLVLGLHQQPPENSCRPSVDVLFRSLASSCGATALGVVMTGMGQDGLLGSGALRQAGGRIIVQDAESSVVWGMPGAVAKAGLAECVVPLAKLAEEIDQRVRPPRRVAGKAR